MNQEKIGAFIQECRKLKKMTQKELAICLGVTDKSVSKWENGVCLPDVSLYTQLCELFGITLNEFFAGERILEENYKEVADENLLRVLENGVFTLKDQIIYFNKKWEREHIWGFLILMVIVVSFIILGFIKNNGMQYLFMIIGVGFGILENRCRKNYIEKNLYGKQGNISIDNFKSSIKQFRETKEMLKQFSNKKEAVFYLLEETGLSKKECSTCYDFIMSLDLDKIHL